MKTKIIIAIAAFMVFGLSIAAVAYTRTTGAASTAMSCCKGDSCPMKGKITSADEKASCCDDCDCCSGDSCPMKNKGEASAMKMADGASYPIKNKAEASAVKMANGVSCPMKKKAAATATTVSFDNTNVVVVADGESCCCSCCGTKKERTDAAGV